MSVYPNVLNGCCVFVYDIGAKKQAFANCWIVTTIFPSRGYEVTIYGILICFLGALYLNFPPKNDLAISQIKTTVSGPSRFNWLP